MLKWLKGTLCLCKNNKLDPVSVATVTNEGAGASIEIASQIGKINVENAYGEPIAAGMRVVVINLAQNNDRIQVLGPAQEVA